MRTIEAPNRLSGLLGKFLNLPSYFFFHFLTKFNIEFNIIMLKY